MLRLTLLYLYYIPIIKFVTTSLGVRYHLVITSYRAKMVRLLRFYTCSKNLDFYPITKAQPL